MNMIVDMNECAKQKLLKHFSVPRMQIDDVEMNMYKQ